LTNSSGLLSDITHSLANWRLLFLVEGLPTVALAAVAFFFLPDSPANARFLSAEDKQAAKARAARQVGGSESSNSKRLGYIVWSDIGAALLDVKVSPTMSEP
jgi:hypothetical protein